MTFVTKLIGRYEDVLQLQYCFLGFFLILVLRKTWNYFQRLRMMPPGPWGIPFLGSVLQLPVSMPWFKFTQWKDEYGPVISLTIAGQSIVVLNTFKAANELLDRRSHIYSDRPRQVVVGEYLTGGVSLAFTPYGPLLRKLRRAVHSGFNQHAVLKYRPLQRREALLTAIDLLDSSENWEAQINRMTVSAILGATYDTGSIKNDETPFVQSLSDVAKTITKAAMPGAYMVEIFPFLNYFPSWLAKWKRTTSAWHEEKTVMFNKFNDHVKERQISGKLNTCFVGELLEGEAQFSLTRRESAWMPGILFLAGYETTTTTLEYWVLAMVLYPETMEKAQEELDRVIGRQRPPSNDDIENLPYIRAMTKEVSRWRPAGPMGVPHSVTQDDWYNGYLIPKGSTVICNVWAMNRDPNCYPDFDVFRPERHLDGTPEGANPVGHSTFGFGRRICPGMHYATQNVCLAIAVILWALRIEAEVDENGEAIIPSDDEFIDRGLTVIPKPFKCRIFPRFPGARDILEMESKGE